MNYQNFIKQKVKEIKNKVGNEKALVALSGGVDSSVVTILAHMALGEKLEAIYIDDFFRKKKEYEFVSNVFYKFGINVGLYCIQERMLNALEGVSDNFKKRLIFRNVFYQAFGEKINDLGIKYFLQGTNKADKEMFIKGQEQHNVGINFQDYGIENMIEPLESLYKPDIRNIASFLGLPKEIVEKQPFPGPGFLVRCLGEITKEKIEIIREAQEISEEELKNLNPFQVVVAISGDKVCSMINRSIPDKYMLFIRALKSKDAMTAEAILPSKKLKNRLEEKIMNISDKIGRILWDTTDKPPATIEYI
jgi:GMP synthase (glutamine-hydrolysing)